VKKTLRSLGRKSAFSPAEDLQRTYQDEQNASKCVHVVLDIVDDEV
jgi:hypothetical protein